MNNKTTERSFQKKVDFRLRRIANFLLLNASFIDNLGLMNGKMGIAIFFYHYARYTQNKIFEDYAGELIDEIYEEINVTTPINFADGLTGIGWGIEYLVSNKFVDADTDEALKEIDNIIYKFELNNPILFNSGDELFGYGFYHIIRFLGKETDNDNSNILMKKSNLIFLTDKCGSLLINKRYLDFDKFFLSTSTINSVLWFLLEMHKLEIFPSKIIKLLQYLPECLVLDINENEIQKDNYLLHYLARSAVESIPNDKIKSLYQNIIDNTNADLIIGTNDDYFVSSLVFLNLQKLIYKPYLNSDNLRHKLFEKAFNIIENEDNWNKRIDQINKYNLGLSGFAGMGLYILNEIIC